MISAAISILFTANCAFCENGITKIELYKNPQKYVIKHKLFTLNIPKYLKKSSFIKKNKNGIIIYDKQSKKEGFGGLAFGILLFEKPSDHAMMPGGRKIGELSNKNKLYDVVLYQPTDVQYNYVKGISKSYKQLYNLADSIGPEINGWKFSTFNDTCGTRGEDLYKDILQKHITAINEKWDSTKLENENMSFMYNVLRQNNSTNKIGYTYYDVNTDGIDELLIGEIADGNWKGIIYDIYTMVDRKPVHVVSGGSRNRYFVCDDGFICNEYSGGANESGMNVYVLVENSTELFPQVGFKYDGYTNPNSPWFISYNIENNVWENVSKDFYHERIKTFETYKRFEFTPLSEFK